MIIFPAIDIKDGKVVRLLQGKFNKVTEYSSDPVQMARHWESQGAKWLHIVDLDGAQTGEMKHSDIIKTIAQKVPVKIQAGGGIREKKQIEELLNAGVERVVLGTKAVEWPEIINAVPHGHAHIAVSLDCSQGKVATKGWTSEADIPADVFVDKLVKIHGLKYLIYTDIETDGMLAGPNFAALEKLLDTVDISVIASGGIANIADIQKLRSLAKKKPHLIGAITGKAIYEGKLDLKEAIRLCSLKE